MGGMKDYAFSVKMRDTIASIAETAIQRLRPSDRYGVVQTLDALNSKCSVLLNGDPDPVTVSMGAVQPALTGQTVRVGGIPGDKFVKDVLGSSPILRGGFLEEVSTYNQRAQVRMTCGGYLNVDSSLNISWTQRIIAIAIGRSANVMPGGYHEIANPLGYTVTNKALTSAVATLTVAAHRLRVGDNITVTGVDATFNGAYVVTATTTTTISYAKAVANVTSVASAGVVGPTIRGHGGVADSSPSILGLIPMATWDTLYYEMPYGVAVGTTPGVNGVVAVTNKALTTNVATLTVTAPHYLAVGDGITVAISDAVFDGSTTVTAVTATTISYAKVNANVTSVAATGYLKSLVNKTIYGNFHKVNYISDFVVPSNWVVIAAHQGDGADSIVWFNGDNDTGWLAVTFTNSWANYGAPFALGAYRKFNGVVYLKGLVRTGTIGPATPIFTLPLYFRPLEYLMFAGVTNLTTTSAASAGTAHTHTVGNDGARLNVYSTGEVSIEGLHGNGFVSIACSFLAEA